MTPFKKFEGYYRRILINELGLGNIRKIKVGNVPVGLGVLLNLLQVTNLLGEH